MAEEAVSTQHGQYTIRGNAHDPAAPSGTGSGVDQVQVYINGPRETGTQLGGVTLNTGNGDWDVTFFPTRFPSMHANLYVYARSAVSGQETMVLRGFDITDSGGLRRFPGRNGLTSVHMRADRPAYTRRRWSSRWKPPPSARLTTNCSASDWASSAPEQVCRKPRSRAGWVSTRAFRASGSRANAPCRLTVCRVSPMPSVCVRTS